MQRKVYSATNTDQISAQYSTAVHLRTMIHRTPHSTHPHNFAKVVEVPNSHRNTLLQYLSAIRRRSLEFSSRICQVVHPYLSSARHYVRCSYPIRLAAHEQCTDPLRAKPFAHGYRVGFMLESFCHRVWPSKISLADPPLNSVSKSVLTGC